MDDDEVTLAGGNSGGATRIGMTVRRPSGPWTPTVQRLLAHLRSSGVTWVPEPLGLDAQGRDVVSYLTGSVAHYPLPEWIWTDTLLVDVGRRLSQLHDATASFDMHGALWQLPVHEPAEVVCHNDVAPYNLVLDGGAVVGLIDWDTASPGPRVWDVAYLAYRMVPLHEPTADGGPLAELLGERRRRLGVLCDAYGHGLAAAAVVDTAVARLDALATWTEERAALNPDVAGHVELYRRDARWIMRHAAALS